MIEIAKYSRGMLVILSLFALVGCGGRGGTGLEEDLRAYSAAQVEFQGSEAAIDEGVAMFEASFHDLTADDVGERMRETYADRFFFNDTLHTFDAVDDLVDYMARTGEALASSKVEIHHVVRDGVDVYVRWTMEFKTRAAGRQVHSKSIGMTHLRFDEQGRVVLHQDFWDSGHALYAHLPWVGFAVRRARSAM